MDGVRDTIHVRVEYSVEDEDYGPVYVASCDEISVVTDGQTFEALVSNLKEAIALHLEGMDTVKTYNLITKPRIVVTMELPNAEIA